VWIVFNVCFNLFVTDMTRKRGAFIYQV